MNKLYTSGNYIIAELDTKVVEYSKSISVYTLENGLYLIKEDIDKGILSIKISEIGNWFDETGLIAFTENTLVSFLRTNTALNTTNQQPGNTASVNVSKNELGYDAWGRAKFIKDNSILHGMFTFNVPVSMWKETFNGSERTITNSTSVNGKLHHTSGAVLNDVSTLSTFRFPRYEPNRGGLYSSSIFLPNLDDVGVRRFGDFTNESGEFFELRTGGVLYAVVRTTIDSITSDDIKLIDTTGIDLSKGNIYDIQKQWRGAGGYKFFLNLQLVQTFDYLGTRTELTMFNPACSIAFECKNLGDNVVIECGCADISSEGGKDNGKVYGSISIDNESGQVAITGTGNWNVPIIAVRSKVTVNGLINTRDTLMLLATAYSDQRSMARVWATRDFTAITDNDQVWRDFGDGHLEYLTYKYPVIATPMSFDTAKAQLIFGSRVAQDVPYATSALFEGRTDIYLTPGDMFIFTQHRETGAACNVGETLEFAEAI